MFFSWKQSNKPTKYWSNWTENKNKHVQINSTQRGTLITSWKHRAFCWKRKNCLSVQSHGLCSVLLTGAVLAALCWVRTCFSSSGIKRHVSASLFFTLVLHKQSPGAFLMCFADFFSPVLAAILFNNSSITGPSTSVSQLGVSKIIPRIIYYLSLVFTLPMECWVLKGELTRAAATTTKKIKKITIKLL